MNQDHYRTDLNVTVSLAVLCIRNVRSCNNDGFRLWILLFDEECTAMSTNWHQSVLTWELRCVIGERDKIP